MPRLARRRPRPPRHVGTFARLPMQSVLRWAGPVVGLAAAVALVLWLQGSGWWSSLRASIQSLDFDPSRAELILAWLAGMTLAGVGALLCGRPWISALAATFFSAATYVWPFGERVRRDVPEVFGMKETFQPAALWHNQAVALGVTLAVALVAAATADLLRRSAVGLATAAWRMLRARRLHAESLLAVAAAIAIGLTALTGLVLAAGVDTVLRYGPEHGVYVPPVVSPRPAISPLDPTQPLAAPEPIPTRGALVPKAYHSTAMSEDRQFLIYLPPTYELKAAAKRHYPVLYLLHGDPGGPSDWVQFGATGIFDAGIATGAIPETIVVFPDGNGHVTASTQWADRFDGRDRIEDALLELVDEVDLEYRTIPDAGHRLIGGLSSGAFGAANIAARHPNLFGTAMSFSGYFVATGPVFGGIPSYIRSNSPYYIVQDDPAARTVRYILVVGNRDPSYQQTNRNFAAVLNQYGVLYDLNILSGGHSADIWQSGLALAMTRMAQKLSLPVFVTNDRKGVPLL